MILGKTNLTELANFMAEDMPSGYSSLGGQVLNPYDVEPARPSGSSSGSGAAAALGLATVTVGTETDGSILCPGDVAEPGRASSRRSAWSAATASCRSPRSQDCAGPMCRTVADAAALLGRSPVRLRAARSRPGALHGVRLAVPPVPDDLHAREAASCSRPRCRCCATSAPSRSRCRALPETDETPVLHHEFARDLDAYLARLPAGAPIRTMAELVAWNEAHADVALKFGQARCDAALAVDHEAEEAAYEHTGLATSPSRGSTASTPPCARRMRQRSCCPVRTARGWAGAGRLPEPGRAGRLPRVGRVPVGLTFLGPARSEALLLGLAYDYEQAAAARRPVSAINPSLLRAECQPLVAVYGDREATTYGQAVLTTKKRSARRPAGRPAASAFRPPRLAQPAARGRPCAPSGSRARAARRSCGRRPR